MIRPQLALLVPLLVLSACPKKKDDAPPAKPAAATIDAAPATPPVTPDAAVAAAEPDDGGHEFSFGGIYEGQAAADLVKILGEPKEKGEGYEEGATGLWLSTWKWPDKGAEISMEGKDAPKAHTLTLKAPFAGKSAAGIGLGSSKAEVQEAYGSQINKKASHDNTLIIGDEYGGTFFTFEGDKLSEIFQGPAAE